MTTLRKLLNGSLRLINAVGTNEDPTADDTRVALKSLNGLVDSMSNDLLNIHTINPYRFVLIPGKQDYTLGPAVDANGNLTGADWVTTRPMRIEQARLMLYPVVTYPTPPAPPPSTCGFVASIADEFTRTLWRFSEDVGSPTAEASVGQEGTPVLSTNAGFQISAEGTACPNSLHLTSTPGSEFMMFADGTYADMTLEFSLCNLGSETFTSNRPVLNWHIFDSNSGEPFEVTINWIENPFQPGLGTLEVIVFDTPWVYQSFNAFGQVESFAFVVDLQEGFLFMYVNGQRVAQTYSLFTFGITWRNQLDIYSGSDLFLDNVRSSNIARYTGDTYEYTLP